MRIASSAALAAVLLLPYCADAFAFTPNTGRNSHIFGPPSSSRLYETKKMAKEGEKVLRKEIADKNSKIENEEKYLVIDGDIPDAAAVAGDGDVATAAAAASGDVSESVSVEASEGEEPKDTISPLQEKINRAIKPRAYPLFLMEKGAQILEDSLKGVTSALASEEVVVNGASESKKERIVVLGTGWGAAAFLKDVDTDKFDVTVISPRNFFLFTPMLAGASVGTVEYRSITEPVREISRKVNFLEATATAVDPKTNTVACEAVTCEGTNCKINDFTVEYDRLILTVGAQTNTFGIKGVREHCCFLKQVEDARRIRTSIVNCFERANYPNLTDEERKEILTFAVIGAGPTGIEFASELRDFVEQDGPKYYPKLLKYVRIKVIEASSTVLAPFDKSLQDEAIKQLNRAPTIKDPAVANLLPEQFKLTELLLNKGVSEVTDEKVLLSDGTEIPYGLAVWAAGNGPLPITLQLIDALEKEGTEQGEAQDVARGRLAVDPWLRVLGGDGKILAFGDCSCVISGQLPATAQVASQQGEFLGKLFSRNYNISPGKDSVEGITLPPIPDPSTGKSLSESIAAFAIATDEYAAPFQFLNLGILAYTGGGSALAQLQVSPSEKGRVKGTGKVGFGLWRSVYLSKQVSWRNRFLVFVDWTKSQLFGRDITRI